MTRLALSYFVVPPLALLLVFCEAGSDGQNTTEGSSTSASGGATGSGGAGGIGTTGPGGPGPANNMCPGAVQSFIWIANTAEGTLSKVCTINGEEVARYTTSPQGATGDPSRTSVNLHGDAVVTNRDPEGGGSSVTKFAADYQDCVDRNNNGEIETSEGGDQVLPWGEDECMLWNTQLDPGAIGARATAWDGTEDPETGEGGHVFIGAMVNRTVYKLDGNDGTILEQAATSIGHYGGAIDNNGNFWTVDMMCTVGSCTIERTSLADLSDRSTHNVHCGYGISVDAKGRIWTAGLAGLEGGCVSRFDPATNENVWATTGGFGDFNRGVAVGFEASAGYVWAANTVGDLIQVDMETMDIVKRELVGGQNMVGVAVDFEGFVWTVSQDAGTAYKIHPETWNVTPVQIGSGPYTYSDMTGVQLKGVIDPPK
jgi:streptogramin lyase